MTSSAARTERLNELSRLQGLPVLPPASFGGVPDQLVGGYGSVLSGVFDNRYPTAFAGLRFDFTARNRAAESQLAQAAIAERRLKLERARVELAIEAQVRNALQAIETNGPAADHGGGVELAGGAGQARQRNSPVPNGRVHQLNFLVLTRQNELADSRQRVVAARSDFNKAAARLRQALGTALESPNIALQ